MSDQPNTELVDQVHEPTTAALAPRDEPSSSLVLPAADDQTIVDAFQRYQNIRSQLLAPEDFQKIAGRAFPKKSAWRKLGTAFGVTLHRVEGPLVERDESGMILRAEVTMRASAPNGRSVDGWGLCDVYERCCQPDCSVQAQRHRHCGGDDQYRGDPAPWTHFSHADHDIPATAMTRASNRALSDLFGFGEVSAEEIVGDPGAAPAQSQAQPSSRQGRQSAGRGQPAGGGESQQSGPQPASDKQITLLSTLLGKIKDGDRWVDRHPDDIMADLEFEVFLAKQYGKRSRKELTKTEASEVIETLQNPEFRQGWITWARDELAKEAEAADAEAPAAADSAAAEEAEQAATAGEA